MKNALVLFGVVLLLWSCSMQNVKTEATTYAGKTKDEVFTAATMALVDCEFTIKTSDKAGGLLLATKGANFATENNAPQVTVLVYADSTGTVGVKIQYVQPGQLADVGGTNKKAIANIQAAMLKYLK